MRGGSGWRLRRQPWSSVALGGGRRMELGVVTGMRKRYTAGFKYSNKEAKMVKLTMLL